MTAEEFAEACVVTCPHCREGKVPMQQMIPNGEWVHITQASNSVTSTICWASGLRNSRFAKESEK